jgi:alpha-L-fucosidase
MNIVCKALDRMLAILAFLTACGAMASADADEAPTPFGAVPSERQLDWHAQQYYAFLHFGPDTFTDEEWGWSQSTPEVFDPTKLDTDEWARELKAAGMTGMILTAKHHDGMALWDTKTTEYRIGNSQWAAKRVAAGLDTDVVRMAAESAKKHGLWFGIYLSPWDMHRDPAVPKPKLKGTKYDEPQIFGDATPGDYNDYYAAQLTELVTMKLPDSSKMDVREVWLDGASGSATVQTFDWSRYRDIIREHQPHAIMWGHQGVDARWVGNEEGRAPETNWTTFDRTQDAPRANPDELETGVRNGVYWTPAEADARLRSGWFYHASESPKSADELLEMYLVTVGRSVNLLLDVPPGPDGKLDTSDIARLQEFRAARERLLGERLVDDKTLVRTSSTRAKNEARFGGRNVVDGDAATYWTMDDAERTGFVELDFGRPQRVTGVVAKEHIALGQRIGEYVIEAEIEGEFETIARGTSMGYQRIHVLPQPVETSGLRLRITQADAVPVVSEFGALSASPASTNNDSISAP